MLTSIETAATPGRSNAWIKATGLILPLLLLGFVGLLVRTAWMSDDAYITLRTVDNFVGGRGLTWNSAERVQAYTHPLWMFVLSAAYAITHEAFYTTIFLSIAVALAAALLLALRAGDSPAAGIFAVTAIALSKAYLDYSTSGLENTLTHLLLVTFCLVCLRSLPAPRSRDLILVGFCAGLIALNRQDAALLVLPATLLAWFGYSRSRERGAFSGAGLLLLGFLPVLLWEAFSVLYYGFPLPNTYFAKLNTGVSVITLAPLGIKYLWVSALIDPVAAGIIVVGLGIAAWKRSPLQLALASGIMLYLLYIISIGGDFMVGRFMTAPFLTALIIIAGTPALMIGFRRLAPALGALVLLSLMSPRSPLRGDGPISCAIDHDPQARLDIADERGCYFRGTGLLQQVSGSKTVPNHGLALDGLRTSLSPAPVSIQGAIGMYSFYAGPNHYVLDLNALANPLLARVPIPQGKPWRIGHFERLVPAGYLETLVSGQNKICDRSLAEYYDALVLITRGPLFSPGRLSAIWKANTHQYDTLIQAYDGTHNAVDQVCNAEARTAIAFEGGPSLVGYRVSAGKLHPGDQLLVTLYWQGQPKGSANLAGFVHIRNGAPGMADNPNTNGDIWAQAEDYQPGGRYTSDYWPAQVYASLMYVRLPDSMPAGRYLLEVGLFDPNGDGQLDVRPESVQPPLRINWRSVLLPDLSVD